MDTLFWQVSIGHNMDHFSVVKNKEKSVGKSMNTELFSKGQCIATLESLIIN